MTRALGRLPHNPAALAAAPRLRYAAEALVLMAVALAFWRVRGLP